PSAAATIPLPNLPPLIPSPYSPVPVSQSPFVSLLFSVPDCGELFANTNCRMSELRLATPPSVPVIDPNDLRVTRLRALRGPNYWRLAPVIACDVRLGALEPVTSAHVLGFNDRLLGALPTLREHPCSSGSPGGFVERLE